MKNKIFLLMTAMLAIGYAAPILSMRALFFAGEEKNTKSMFLLIHTKEKLDKEVKTNVRETHRKFITNEKQKLSYENSELFFLYANDEEKDKEKNRKS